MTEQTTCRRCSECVGQDHHWMENQRFNQDGDPEYVCKHCEAACAGVDDDDGFMVPSGVLLAQPAVCDECDEYVSGCLCDLDNGVDEPGDGDDCPECGEDIDDCECDALAEYSEEP